MIPSQSLATPPEIPGFLRPLRTLLLAVFTADGDLVDANRGFRQLLPGEQHEPTPEDIRDRFINPTFDVLCADARDYRPDNDEWSRITIGDVDGEAETWLGRVERHGAWLILICERDVEQDRQLARQLLELTDDYATKERELARTHRELERHARSVEQLMATDPLTGLANRLHFDRSVERELARVKRYGSGLALLLVDLDHFKALNDAYGHDYGDEVLRRLADTLRETVRDADLVARWGGEEFAVLTAHTGEREVEQLAERLRAQVERIRLDAPAPTLTCSIGATVARTGDTPETLFQRTDRALYHAKHSGRNRVAVAAVD